MPLTNNSIFYADSSTPGSIVDVFAAMATSVNNRINVLQVVNKTKTGVITTTDTTNYADSFLYAEITPLSLTSKIIALVNLPFRVTNNANTDGADFVLSRNGEIISASRIEAGNVFMDSFLVEKSSAYVANYVDEPATLSRIKYSVLGKPTNMAGFGDLRMNYTKSNITLLEVA